MLRGKRTCVVLGAGLSGLVAALELARRDYEVTVIESAPFAGGRTSSWRTASGRHADTGLHVIADHYLNLFEVLETVGAGDVIAWSDSHLYLRPGVKPLDFRFSPLPSPLHLLHPYRSMPLALAEKWRLFRAGLELSRLPQRRLEQFDGVTFLDWLKGFGIRDPFIFELADFAADATSFLSAGEVAARPVLSWIKYVFRSRRGARIGLWRRPMAEALIAPIVQAIRKAGGRVCLGRAVVRLTMEGPRIDCVVTRTSNRAGPCHGQEPVLATNEGGWDFRADHIICALPVQALRAVIGPELAGLAGIADALSLKTVPAVSVILKLNGRLQPAVPGVPVVSGSWIRDFVDLEAIWGDTNQGSLVQALLSHSTRSFGWTDPEVISAAFTALNEVWPASRQFRVVEGSVERIQSAMFAAVPGAERCRAHQETRIPNFHLAGDWTRHELNASMEGAVISGRLAAGAVLRRDGLAPVPIAQVPTPWFEAPFRR